MQGAEEAIAHAARLVSSVAGHRLWAGKLAERLYQD